MTNNKQQTEALRKNFKKIYLKRCGNCQAMNSLYEAYDVKLVGNYRWCYTCGARDEQTYVKENPASGGGKGKSVSQEIMELRQELIRRGLKVY